MSISVMNRASLCITYSICAIVVGLFSNSTYLNVLTSLYLISYSPTLRWTDLSSPIISLFVSSLFYTMNGSSIYYYIQSWAVYTLCYFVSIGILTIILPRYTLNQFTQPKNQIIASTKTEKCGFIVYLERNSPNNALMDKLKKMGDAEADQIWPDLWNLIRRKKYVNMDAVDVLLENVDSNPKFKRFVERVSSIPRWCDFDKLENAQKLHQRYCILFSYVLAVCTLVGGFGCPQINKVLISSRYWANNNDHKSLKNTLNRLRETAVWLFSVMRDTDSLR